MNNAGKGDVILESELPSEAQGKLVSTLLRIYRSHTPDQITALLSRPKPLAIINGINEANARKLIEVLGTQGVPLRFVPTQRDAEVGLTAVPPPPPQPPPSDLDRRPGMVNGYTPSTQEASLPSKTKKFMSAKRATAIVVVYFLAQVLIGIVLGVAAGLFLAFTHGSDPSRVREMTSLLILPISVLSVIVAAFITLWMTFRTLRGPKGQDGLESIGWRTARTRGIIAALFAGCFIALTYIFVLVPINPPGSGQKWGFLTSAAQSPGWQRILWAIFALGVAPPIEEFIFRGVFLAGLTRAAGVYLAAFVVTLVFVISHVMEIFFYWPAWAAITLLACLLVLFRIKTGSLLPAIFAHFGYNLIIVIYAFAA